MTLELFIKLHCGYVSSKLLYCSRQEVFNVILGLSFKVLFVQYIFGIVFDPS